MRRERPRSWSSPMAIWMLFALVVYPSTVLPLRSKIFGGEKDYESLNIRMHATKGVRQKTAVLVRGCIHKTTMLY
jgi:hypothetical protein